MRFYIDDVYLGDLIKSSWGQDVGYVPNYRYQRFLVSCGISFIIPTGFYRDIQYRGDSCYVYLNNNNTLFRPNNNKYSQPKLYIDGIYFDEFLKRTIHKDKGYVPDHTCSRFLLRCGISVLIPVGCIRKDRMYGNEVYILTPPENPLFP